MILESKMRNKSSFDGVPAVEYLIRHLRVGTMVIYKLHCFIQRLMLYTYCMVYLCAHLISSFTAADSIGNNIWG